MRVLLAFNTILILKNSGFDVTLMTCSSHNKKNEVNLVRSNGIFFIEPKYADDYLSRFGSEIDVVYGTRYNAYGYYLNILKIKCIKAKFIFSHC